MPRTDHRTVLVMSSSRRRDPGPPLPRVPVLRPGTNPAKITRHQNGRHLVRSSRNRWSRPCQTPDRLEAGFEPGRLGPRLRVSHVHVPERLESGCPTVLGKWPRLSLDSPAPPPEHRPHPNADFGGIADRAAISVEPGGHEERLTQSPSVIPGGEANSEEPETELALTVERHGRCQPISPADQEESFEREQRRGEEKDPERADEIGRNAADEM